MELENKIQKTIARMQKKEDLNFIEQIFNRKNVLETFFDDI